MNGRLSDSQSLREEEESKQRWALRQVVYEIDNGGRYEVPLCGYVAESSKAGSQASPRLSGSPPTSNPWGPWTF
jgi:hypothetical protein